MIDINTALGMTSERPLQVGDSLVVIDTDGQSHVKVLRVDPPRDEVAELREQVRILNEICDDIRDTFGYSRDDMVDLTTYVAQDYAELKEQLADVTRERDGLKLQSGNYLGVRDNPDFDCTDAAHPAWWRGHDHTANVFCQLVNEILDGKDVSSGISGEPWQATKTRLAKLREQLATVQSQLTDWMDTAEALYKAVPVAYARGQLPENGKRKPSEMVNEYLAEVQAEAAAMRKLLIGWRGWIERSGLIQVNQKAEIAQIDTATSGTAGRELLDEMRRKDERIADLECQLAAHKRDAELCRELRAFLLEQMEILRGCVVAQKWVGSDTLTAKLNDLLVAIRDGGAK